MLAWNDEKLMRAYEATKKLERSPLKFYCIYDDDNYNDKDDDDDSPDNVEVTKKDTAKGDTEDKNVSSHRVITF